jgi:CO dehydrogenase/acetyl-CoA synthase alpha subunit
VHIVRLTKERDEQIELVIERLESEKEELVIKNKKEVATKVNEMVADKLEVERELKEYKSKFSDLSNAVLLVHSFKLRNMTSCPTLLLLNYNSISLNGVANFTFRTCHACLLVMSISQPLSHDYG